MSHARKIGIAVGVAVLALVCFIPTTTGNEQPVQKFRATKALSNAKQVGLGLTLYSDDYHGAFPSSLQALFPDYLPNSGKPLLDNLEFVTPGANLKELTPDTVILRSMVDGYVLIVRADNSVAMQRR